MSEIPADIRQTAEEWLTKPVADQYGNHLAYFTGNHYRAEAATVIAMAILAERERCEIACQALIDEYVTDERARCANSVWDFYYGEKRGHVTPEEFAEFLQPKP